MDPALLDTGHKSDSKDKHLKIYIYIYNLKKCNKYFNVECFEKWLHKIEKIEKKKFLY